MTSHLKAEFQKLIKVSSQNPERDGWNINVNEHFELHCQFVENNFLISSRLGAKNKLKNTSDGYRNLLLNLTRNLPSVRESLSINPADGFLMLTRNVRKPTLVSELEGALTDFANTYEFLKSVYTSST